VGHPGGRQFQRQWQTVQPAADLHHRERIVLIERKIALDGLRALDKEPHGRTIQGGVGRQRAHPFFVTLACGER
jgi:hypothetical protein